MRSPTSSCRARRSCGAGSATWWKCSSSRIRPPPPPPPPPPPGEEARAAGPRPRPGGSGRSAPRSARRTRPGTAPSRPARRTRGRWWRSSGSSAGPCATTPPRRSTSRADEPPSATLHRRPARRASKAGAPPLWDPNLRHCPDGAASSRSRTSPRWSSRLLGRERQPPRSRGRAAGPRSGVGSLEHDQRRHHAADDCSRWSCSTPRGARRRVRGSVQRGALRMGEGAPCCARIAGERQYQRADAVAAGPASRQPRARRARRLPRARRGREGRVGAGRDGGGPQATSVRVI
jgi:hypothetical protein